jgi:hypothetical protein
METETKPMESLSGKIMRSDLMLGPLSTVQTLTRKNSVKKLPSKHLRVQPQIQVVIKRCSKIANITPSQSRDGQETCIQLYLKPTTEMRLTVNLNGRIM